MYTDPQGVIESFTSVFSIIQVNPGPEQFEIKGELVTIMGTDLPLTWHEIEMFDQPCESIPDPAFDPTSTEIKCIIYG